MARIPTASSAFTAPRGPSAFHRSPRSRLAQGLTRALAVALSLAAGLPGSIGLGGEGAESSGGLAPAPAAAAPAGGKAAFDLEARKREQAWLWQAPRPQAAPKVRDTTWAKDAVDRFLLARLETAGLRPAVPADDRTWLRRVHFVLTGLPPGREETAMFLGDRASGARERAVDRLLASPHFGERWARHWMDLMRYAESRGHESDYPIANAWQYRDYLIRAFNADVPHDQLLLEHLAGDLLPEPRLRPDTDLQESVLATGWAFLGEENHSPVDIRQDECERIDNKVDVFSKTFLGLTVSCARCHDHKFDPIRAEDYYALSGFVLGSSFRQVRFEAIENNRRMAAELARLRAGWMPRLARETARAADHTLEDLVPLLEAARERLLPAATPTAQAKPSARGLNPTQLARWTAELASARTNRFSPLHPLAQWPTNAVLARPAPATAAATAAAAAAPAVATATPPGPGGGDVATFLPPDARVVADYTAPGRTPWKADGEAFGTGPLSAGDLVPGLAARRPIERVMAYGAARRDPFWNRLHNAPGNENDAGRLGATARAGRMLRTPTVTLTSGRLHYLLRGRTRVYAAVDSHLMNDGPLHGRMAETFDTGAGPEPRWVTHDLTPYAGHRAHVEFGADGDRELEILLVVDSPTAPTWRPGTGAFQPSAGARTFTDAARELQSALSHAHRELTRGQLQLQPPRKSHSTAAGDLATTAALATWLVQRPDLFQRPEPASAPETGGTSASAKAAGLHRAADLYEAGLRDIASRVRWESRTAVAWLDGTGVDEHVLLRGKPFKPGPLAPRSLPAAFPGAKPITAAGTSGRLELARQLVDPSNPLVARVAVNRAWHHVFGRGIVPTVDNFGALGERPSHPELLDQLAWDFVHRDGWSLKQLLRRLVLTQAFAMDSTSSDPRAASVDPANLLLHRMPVRRLEAEIIRDALLAVSGRLNPRVGGPPVPVHLTEFIVGRGRPDQSGPLDGDGRRSLYLATRRNFLPTLMQTFDTPTPFSTVGRRNVTNVPAQSLALMNDPLFHQQARVLIARLRHETPGATDRARLDWLFETLYGRPPTGPEQSACRESLTELRALHGETAGPGPAADDEAWVSLGHALLNANDFIYVK